MSSIIQFIRLLECAQAIDCILLAADDKNEDGTPHNIQNKILCVLIRPSCKMK